MASHALLGQSLLTPTKSVCVSRPLGETEAMAQARKAGRKGNNKFRRLESRLATPNL